MAAASLTHTVRSRPDVFLAALGLVSGILSATVGTKYEPEWLQAPGKLFFLDAGAMPIGLYFAVAMSIGLWLATGRLLAVPVVFIGTMYAWSAAIRTATAIISAPGDVRLMAGSLLAGAVGAALTYVVCALLARELRTGTGLAQTVVVGGLVGAVYYLNEKGIVAEGWLFAAWQPCVAYCIGRGLSPPGRA